MHDATPHDLLLHTLHCAIQSTPSESANRLSLLQTLRYTRKSGSTADNGQRRVLLRIAAAHLKQADKNCHLLDEHSALSEARRAMTAALFECAAMRNPH